MKYYELHPDFFDDAHWTLGPPIEAGTGSAGRVWRFIECQPVVEVGELVVPIAGKGQRVEINMTAFGAWIITPEVGQLIDTFVPAADLQRIRCTAEDGTPTEILNPLVSVDCFDPARSEGVIYFSKKDRPECEGKVKWARRWLLDPARAAGNHLFRVKDDELRLIVSEDLKLAIQVRGFGGAVFQCVC
jgi:hypothetical protein